MDLSQYCPVRAVIFDLDGVLVDSRGIHLMSLNRALEEVDPKYVIGLEEHLARFDGLPTTRKLALLTETRGLPQDLHDSIWRRKQDHTTDLLRTEIRPSPKLVSLLEALKGDGLKLFCASNSVRATLDATLEALGIAHLFDGTYAAEEVGACKPHPAVYVRAYSDHLLPPRQVVVVEDSPVGRVAAALSGAHVCAVSGPEQVTLERVRAAIREAERLNHEAKFDTRWVSDVQVVIPMAGEGSRFVMAGYATPKPLIDIDGRPMIQWVADNLNVSGAKFIFVVRSSHLQNKEWRLRERLEEHVPGCVIVPTDTLTQGPACSVLLAAPHLDPEKPLLVANSDQYLEWDANAFLYESEKVDGCISVFRQPDPDDRKWSYARLDENGFVAVVREKEPISDIASTGVYYWRRAGDFIRYTNQMMDKGVRVNNEFYVCPVYNEAIADGKRIRVSFCKRMWGLGVPADLRAFYERFLGRPVPPPS